MHDSETKTYHLVVLVHGLWGCTAHFDYISNALDDAFHSNSLFRNGGRLENEEIVVYTTHLNEGYKTYDGIDVCGLRVAREIEEQIEELGSVTKFSLCGYSLGGLIARYALGALYKKQLFKKHDIRLLNFTTFCTPHVGVYAPGNNFAVKLFNAILPNLLGSSGKQMFLQDCVKSANGLPLLYLMSSENSIFYNALQEFEYKALYANVINDKRTAWWTSGISRNNPFFDVDEYNGATRFSYIPGYEPIVIDHTKPIQIKRIEDAQEELGENADLNENQDDTDAEQRLNKNEYFFINYWIAKMGRWLMVLINILLIAPLYIMWFCISGVMETTKSTIRATRYVGKYSNQLIHDFYEISPEVTDDDDEVTSVLTNEYEQQIQETLNDQRDTLIESVFDAIERKNTYSAVVDEASSRSESCEKETTDGEEEHEQEITEHSMKTTIQELEQFPIEEILARFEHNSNELPSLENFHLSLTPAQLEIIDSLNKIKWKKFPIYIRKTPSTHACAIVRHADPNFGEGEVIVRHWIEKVFRFE